MSMEPILFAAVQACCPRVFWDEADAGTQPPYVVCQAVGGRSLRYADNTPADKRHTVMQISAWARSRSEATTLSRQIEEALCSATALTARPEGEPVSTKDDDLRGSQQDFSIWAAR